MGVFGIDTRSMLIAARTNWKPKITIMTGIITVPVGAEIPRFAYLIHLITPKTKPNKSIGKPLIK